MKKTIVLLYSSVHFIVDLSCAVLATNLLPAHIGTGTNLFIAIIIYNFCAFVLQLPIGIIADKLNKNALYSAFGLLLVASAYFLKDSAIIALMIAGIGNAMFHIGGGIDVLNISDKKASLPGIFVSTGALGIYLGTKSASWGFDNYLAIILALLSGASALVILYNFIKNKVKNKEVIIQKLNKIAIISIICLIITVCIRSYVGFILAFEWKSELLSPNFMNLGFPVSLALISILAVIFGKMLGGIIGDKIGFKKISILSLGLAAVLFIFAFDYPILGILAILFFNMTMPITLTALSNILDNNKGMAFGMLTTALFIGFIPIIFDYDKILFSSAGLFGITTFSLVVLYIGIHNYFKFIEK